MRPVFLEKKQGKQACCYTNPESHVAGHASVARCFASLLVVGLRSQRCVTETACAHCLGGRGIHGAHRGVRDARCTRKPAEHGGRRRGDVREQ